jgi:hypothetical protein
MSVSPSKFPVPESEDVETLIESLLDIEGITGLRILMYAGRLGDCRSALCRN